MGNGLDGGDIATMRRGALGLVVAMSFLFSLFLVTVTILPERAKAATLYVGGPGPGNYTTIQAAINAASPGDSIYVYTGMYNESVIVGKTLSLIGQDMNTTVVNGGLNAYVFRVTADWVNITGFTVTTNPINWGNSAINLVSVRHCRIDYNNVTLNGFGIDISNSYNITVTHNNLSINQRDIFIVNSERIILSNNNIERSEHGMSLAYSKDMDIFSNRYSDVVFSIYAGYSDNVRIHGNTFSPMYSISGYGVYLESSRTAAITNNTFNKSGIFLEGALLEHWNTHSIDTSNTVNGKPVYYWKNLTDGSVPLGAGQVILANTRNVTVQNQNVSDTVAGIEAGFSPATMISHVTANSDRMYGVYLQFSGSSTISNLTFSNNTWAVLLNNSGSSAVVDNNLFSDWSGIKALSSINCAIEGNNIVERGVGIVLTFSDSCKVANNTVDGRLLSGMPTGVDVGSSTNSVVADNNVSNYYTGITLYAASNTTMTNVMVTRNTLFNNTYGVEVAFASDNTIDGNNLSHGYYDAIRLWQADKTTVVNNVVSDNGGGITVSLSNDCAIYHNSFINNTQQAAAGGVNFWDDGYPSGGNYWSDYAGTDTLSGPNQDQPGSDGIGDTPYPIWGGTDADRYPLMAPYGIQSLSAPRNLQAIAGNAQVTLTWQAPTSDGGYAIRNYTIYRGTDSGGETILRELGNVQTYTDTGLTNGQVYYYQVAAKNAIREGPRSNEVNATPMTAPSEPQNLQAAAGNSQATLTWATPTSDGGSPITNYRIYQGTTSGGETFFTETGNVVTYTITSLTNGQTYFYKVASKSAAGEGAQSNEAKTTPATTPSEPLNVRTIAGNGQITITWMASASDGGSPITYYTIYRGTTPGSGTLLVTIGNVLTYVDTSLTNGVTYHYTVAAVNRVGQGPNSTEANATPATTPSEPLNLAATSGDGQVTLTWTAPASDGGSSITNYTVYRGSTSGGETMLITLGNVLTYTNTGLTNGQTYYYTVNARNDMGSGLNSTEVSATPATTPSEPLNLQVSYVWDTTAGSGYIVLTWSPPTTDGGSPITNYRIYRGTEPGNETLLVIVGNVLNHNDTAAAPLQKYYYRVSAVNAIGEGPNSTEVTAELIPRSPPPAPKSILEEPWFWAIVAVVILVAAAVLILRKKKGRQEKEVPPEKEEQAVKRQNPEE